MKRYIHTITCSHCNGFERYIFQAQIKMGISRYTTFLSHHLVTSMQLAWPKRYFPPLLVQQIKIITCFSA